jgi:cyanophycinase
MGKARSLPGKGKLFVVGGDEDPDESDMIILPRLVELAGGSNARLLLCAAPAIDAEDTLTLYQRALKKTDLGELLLLPLQEREEAESDEALEALERATAVYFTGGDQLRIPPRVAGTRFGDRLEERFREGLLVGGTSAGAVVLCGTMIIRGQGETVSRNGVEMAPGLGFWPNAIVDVHFDRSGRVHRLLSVVAQNPGILGLGLDVDTAVEVEPGKRFTVVGRGSAIVIDGRVTHSTADRASSDAPIAMFGVNVHVLPDGYGYDLAEHAPLMPGQKSATGRS